MKKIALGFIGLLVIAIVALFILGRDVREIKTEIQISAQPDQVWTVLTKIDGWKDWNSTIKMAEGEPSQGSVLNITINGNGNPDSNYQPVVIEANAPQSFRWRANMGSDFIFRNDRVFQLEISGDGTKLIHKEEFSGIMVPLMWSMFQDFVGPTLEKMNSDLKSNIESKSTEE